MSLRKLVLSTRSQKRVPNTIGVGDSQIVGIPMSLPYDPLPVRYPCKFRYQSTKKLTVGLAAFGTEVLYRLNSLYDPDFSGAGDYPFAFQSFQALYKNYRVHAVTLEVEFTDPSVDGLVGGVLVGATNNTAALAGQTLDWAGARPMIATVMVNNTGGQKALIRQRFSIDQIDGIRRTQLLGDPNYQAATTTNPTNTPFLRVAIAAEDTGNSTATMYAQIRLIFEAELFDRVYA